jgi:PKD repeat protein
LYVNDGCSYDTVSQIINVDSLPEIDIQVSDSILCTNDIFYFFNNSQNTSIIWDFDDGNSSYLTNPIHSFSNPGNYNVKITVTSSINGCVNNDSLMLTSLINPDINLDLSDSIGCPPLNVQFINNSSNADYYSWDFDDGNFATFQSGNHNYTNSGVYNGTFIATSINGCLDSLNFLITVHPTPTSRFNLNSSDVCYPPATAYFTNNSISANSYFWNFGNGDSSQLTSPTSIFSVGTFNIELIAQNIFGCEDFSDTSFVVYNTPISSFNLLNDSICLRDSFAFESTSLFYDSLLWDLDNGFYSNDSAFKYLFLDTGLYNITLYAYNTVGNCVDTSIGNNYIYVKNSPYSDFYFTNNVSPIYPRSGTIEFYNNSLFSDYYLWNFDFSDSSSLENPIYNYSYNNDGFYGYTLYSYSENGCIDSLRKEIYISYEKGLFVPNAFCPTHINNELNKFKPRATGLREYHIEIFDLYGNKLWESRDLENSEPKEAWDGTFNGVLLMQDVYVWKISALFKDDVVWDGIKYTDKNVLKKTGTVTLIR